MIIEVSTFNFQVQQYKETVKKQVGTNFVFNKY